MSASLFRTLSNLRLLLPRQLRQPRLRYNPGPVFGAVLGPARGRSPSGDQSKSAGETVEALTLRITAKRTNLTSR